MRRTNFTILIVCIVISGCITQPESINDGRINDYNSLIEEFEDPGIDYRPAPLWVWNNEVSMEDIDFSMAELKKQGMGGVYIHPRRGLITEYLSDEWFELVAYSMKKAKEVGLNIWLYDENVCPSGFAGGHVYQDMPESYNQGTSLTNRKMKELDLSDQGEQKVKFVFKKEDDTWTNITESAKNEEGKSGDYAVMYLRNFRTGNTSYANFSYVDLIAKGVTQKFMEVTMKGYEKVGSHEFGKLIPGIFTDEPQIGSEGGIRYTPDLFDEFSKRWGYKLVGTFFKRITEHINTRHLMPGVHGHIIRTMINIGPGIFPVMSCPYQTFFFGIIIPWFCPTVYKHF